MVVPNIVVDGAMVEHCPPKPDWDWIRDYGSRCIQQARNYDQHDGMPCWQEIPVDDGTPEGIIWHCRKQYGHTGEHSPKNECGAYSEKNRICGLPNNHAGPHPWVIQEER